jgi:hypothetical protein
LGLICEDYGIGTVDGDFESAQPSQSDQFSVGVNRCGSRSHRSDGVSGETNPLCRTAGFDALFAITAVEVAQVRDIMEKMVAAPR